MVEKLVLALETFDISATELLFLQACKNHKLAVCYASETLGVA